MPETAAPLLAAALLSQAVPAPSAPPAPSVPAAPVTAPVPVVPAPPPLLPPPVARSDILLAALAASPDHRWLLAAIRAAGMADTLSAPTATTLFAPTDAAFARLAPR